MATANFFAPGFDATIEQGEIDRKRALAEALRQQSVQPSQGGMAGNVYVGPSWTQGLAKMLQAYGSKKMGEAATEREQALGQASQARNTQDVTGFMQALQGSPERTLAPLTPNDDEGNAMPSAIQPAAAPDNAKAMALALKSPTLQPVGMDMLKQQMLVQQIRGALGQGAAPGQQPAAPGATPAAGAPGVAGSAPPAGGGTGGVQNSAIAMDILTNGGKGIGGMIQKANEPLVNRGFGINKLNPVTGNYDLDPGSLAGISAAEQAKADVGNANTIIDVPTGTGTSVPMTKAQVIAKALRGQDGAPAPAAPAAMPPAGPMAGGLMSPAPRAANQVISPAVQAGRNSEALQVLQSEVPAAQARLAEAQASGDPKKIALAQSDLAGIQREIQRESTRPAPFVIGQTTTAKKEQEGYGEGLAAQQKTIDEKAAAAQVVKARVGEMRQLSQNFTSGSVTPLKEKLGGLMIGLGADPQAVNEKLGNISDMQAFNKEALNMAFEMTRALTSRPAASEVMLALKANPNLALQPDASKKIMDMVEGMADYQAAEQQEARKWREQKQTLDGFAAHWNKNFPLSKFVDTASMRAPNPQGSQANRSASASKLKPNASGGFDYHP
jgi:hypothetical protein